MARAWFALALAALLGTGAMADGPLVDLTPIGAWLAEDIGGAGVIDDAQTTLVIAADGTVTGSGGCNGYGGAATIGADSLSFGSLAGTRMACAEAIMNQENRFHEALSRTASFRIDADGKLLLLDAGGAELVRLAAN